MLGNVHILGGRHGAALVLLLVAFSVGIMPAQAARHAAQPTQLSAWQQRDTTAYVISTLNLLSPLSPQDLTRTLRGTCHVVRYAAYADPAREQLYFIKLLQPGGRPVGTFAYRLGWTLPQAVTRIPSILHASKAGPAIMAAYDADKLTAIGMLPSLDPQ